MPERWQVFATGNHLKLAEDLPRRSLVVFLSTGEKASERDVAEPMTNTVLFSDALPSARLRRVMGDAAPLARRRYA